MTPAAGTEFFEHDRRMRLAVALPAPFYGLVFVRMTSRTGKGGMFCSAFFEHLVSLSVAKGAIL